MFLFYVYIFFWRRARTHVHAHARTHAFGSKKIGYLYSLAPAAQKSAIKLGLSDVYLHETKESSKKSVALSERDINLVRIIINTLFQNQFDKC